VVNGVDADFFIVFAKTEVNWSVAEYLSFLNQSSLGESKIKVSVFFFFFFFFFNSIQKLEK
jgi:hypothetical protein